MVNHHFHGKIHYFNSHVHQFSMSLCGCLSEGKHGCPQSKLRKGDLNILTQVEQEGTGDEVLPQSALRRDEVQSRFLRMLVKQCETSSTGCEIYIYI